MANPSISAVMTGLAPNAELGVRFTIIKRQWRHLDTCQYRTILHASPPRSECAEHEVRVVKLPWAEANSRSVRGLSIRLSGELYAQTG